MELKHDAFRVPDDWLFSQSNLIGIETGHRHVLAGRVRYSQSNLIGIETRWRRKPSCRKASLNRTLLELKRGSAASCRTSKGSQSNLIGIETALFVRVKYSENLSIEPYWN